MRRCSKAGKVAGNGRKEGGSGETQQTAGSEVQTRQGKQQRNGGRQQQVARQAAAEFLLRQIRSAAQRQGAGC